MIQMSNILKVKANLRKYKTIKTNKSTSRIIDGSYNSVYKGRSMNFDELRDYVPGDEIRDIDWKATARSQKVLVRQFIAEKKHNIMLVIDDFLGRSDLSLEGVILNLANPFIKICVAFFIFLAAATPAKFISLHKMHNLL